MLKFFYKFYLKGMIKVLSIPPDKKEPKGTSEINCSSTASNKHLSNDLDILSKLSSKVSFFDIF